MCGLWRLTWSCSGALFAAGAEDGGVFRVRRDVQQLCTHTKKMLRLTFSDSIARYSTKSEKLTKAPEIDQQSNCISNIYSVLICCKSTRKKKRVHQTARHMDGT
jgi:hypothetical protein